MLEILETRVTGLGIIGVGLVTLLVLQRMLSWRHHPKGLSLPPGPPRWPIIGNLFDFPTQQEWVAFAQLAKKYGDLVYLTAFGKSIVFVNSADIAYELFEKRSSIYSDRSEMPMIRDLMGWGWATALLPYGDLWRTHRKFLYRKLHTGAVAEYQPIQLHQTRVLLQRLHETPGDFLEHLRHTAGAIIMEVAYGINVLPKDDPYISTAEKAIAGASEAGNPGAFLVDLVPILKYVPEWFPGAGFQRKAKVWRRYADDMGTKPFAAVKQTIISGTAVPSYTSSLLEELSLSKDVPDQAEQERVIRDTAATMYTAGADTTVNVLHTFFLAMVLFPEAQRRAQQELDEVVDSTRLPEFEDRANLLYINALCKEVLRWHPIIPLGVAHSVTRDDVFGRYLIPKGSLVLGFAWYMLHDEATYGPDTDKFLPERFLTPGVKDPTAGFGFGRRICSGQHLADNSIFIAVASILSVFDITPSRDDNGEEIPVRAAFRSGLFSAPEAFQCTIRPRSDTVRKLIFEDSTGGSH